MSDKTFTLKKEFVSESAIKKREQEWEQAFENVKQSKRVAETARVETDTRSLFEKLQEQKLKKEEALQEEYKLANRIHRLDEEEACFLQDWKESKAAQSAKAKEEEEVALAGYRQQKSKLAGATAGEDCEDTRPASAMLPAQPRPLVLSRQKALLSLAVRPRTRSYPSVGGRGSVE